MHLPVDPARYATFLGVMAVMAATPGPANLFAIATGAQKGKGAALVGVDVRQFMLLEPDCARTHLSQLLAWADDGRLAPPLGRAFSLDRYAEALEFALTGQGLGKTVIEVADL